MIEEKLEKDREGEGKFEGISRVRTKKKDLETRRANLADRVPEREREKGVKRKEEKATPPPRPPATHSNLRYGTAPATA